MAEAYGPLQDVKVVACSTAQAGTVPYMLMADLGAEVIKVEVPGTGGNSRGTGVTPGFPSTFLKRPSGRQERHLEPEEAGRAGNSAPVGRCRDNLETQPAMPIVRIVPTLEVRLALFGERGAKPQQVAFRGVLVQRPGQALLPRGGQATSGASCERYSRGRPAAASAISIAVGISFSAGTRRFRNPIWWNRSAEKRNPSAISMATG
jgi:hypothetical protein